MKTFFLLFLVFLAFPLRADIWEKPVYTPDENHLPQEKQEQEEESIKDESVDKDHQDTKLPQDKTEKKADEINLPRE